MPPISSPQPARSSHILGWVTVACLATLTTIGLVHGAFNAPDGSDLQSGLVSVIGIVTGIDVVLFVTLIFWIPSHIRVRHILAEAPNAPAVHVAALAEDGNAILTALGTSHSFTKPQNAIVSFGATPAGITVYRRFNHEITFYLKERIDDIFYERRPLASGSDREVMTFVIRDEWGVAHHLSFSIFSPGKLYMLPYSRQYLQILLSAFKEALGLPPERQA